MSDLDDATFQGSDASSSTSDFEMYDESSNIILLLERSHEYVTDDDDVRAFKVFKKSTCGHRLVGLEDGLSTGYLWQKWLELPPEEREKFYKKAELKRVSKDAFEMFESETPYVEGAVSSNFCHQCDFEKLPEAEKKVFFDRVREKNKKYAEKESPPEDPTLVNNLNAVLMLRPLGEYFTHSSCPEFHTYCLRMRPYLLQEPGMSAKRGLQLAMILAERWLELGTDEHHIYAGIYERVKDMIKKVESAKLFSGPKALEGNFSHLYLSRPRYCWTSEVKWFSMPDAERQRYDESATRARWEFMQEFPDFNEFFHWVLPLRQEAYPPPIKHVYQSYSTKPKKDSTVIQPKTSIIAYDSCDPGFFINQADEDAVEQFRISLCPHSKEDAYLDVVWQQFIELSEAEQDSYYAKVRRNLKDRMAYRRFYDEQTFFTPDKYDDEDMCSHCEWRKLDAKKKKAYYAAVQRELAQIPRSIERTVYPESYQDSTHWLKDHKYEPLQLYKISDNKVAENSVRLFIHKNWQSLMEEPGMKDLRRFRASLILERRFWNLNPAEREVYFDMARRMYQMYEELSKRNTKADCLYWNKVSPMRPKGQKPTLSKFTSSKPKPPKQESWYKLSETKKGYYKRRAMAARRKFMKQFPDVDQFFGFVDYSSMDYPLNELHYSD